MLGLALCRILGSPSHKSVSLILPLDMNTRAVHTHLGAGDPPPPRPHRLLSLSPYQLHQEAVGPGDRALPAWLSELGPL